MTISSRTPEGDPGHCPVCRNHVTVEPSITFGDAPCPRCGQLLWFLHVGPHYLFLEHPGPDAARAWRSLLAERIGVSEHELLRHPEWIEDLDLDSLDLVELMTDF